MSELREKQWFAVINDEVGGWAVATEDKPLSQVPNNHIVCAMVTHERTAKHIALLQNSYLLMKHINFDLLTRAMDAVKMAEEAGVDVREMIEAIAGEKDE